MATQLAVRTSNKYLVPAQASKNVVHRIKKFVDWLDATGGSWREPDLTSYRDSLLEKYAASSVNAHLSTVRGRYKKLIADNATRDVLFAMASNQTDDIVERKAFVDEMITRLANAINPLHSSVKVETKQDVTDSEELRLTIAQAEALIHAPGIDTLQGLRDTAIIALALATGLREAELANLEVKDLRQRSNGKLGVYVHEGKGCKSRFVPYGNFEQVLTLVDSWLDGAGIEDGRVFRSFYHHSKSTRNSISKRAIQNIFRRYPVMIDGEQHYVRPHDARRSYAKICYNGGMDIVAIQQNLGHSNIQTTLGYIGDLDMEKREPKASIRFV